MIHSRWSTLLQDEGLPPSVYRDQLTYVRGYILALIDTLRDIAALKGNFPYESLPAQVAFDNMIAEVKRNLRQAEETEATLRRLLNQTRTMEEPSDSEQGQGGAVRSGPGG